MSIAQAFQSCDLKQQQMNRISQLTQSQKKQFSGM
jgi:hypothetical protein